VKAARWPLSIVNVLLLAGCTYFAWHELFGLMFGMGESGGSPGLLGGAFLLVTALGVVGFAIAALGTFSRVRVFGLLGLASAIASLPAAAIFAWQEVRVIVSISNSNDPWLRSWYQAHTWYRVESFLPAVLDLAAICLSALWLRQLARTNALRSPAEGSAALHS